MCCSTEKHKCCLRDVRCLFWSTDQWTKICKIIIMIMLLSVSEQIWELTPLPVSVRGKCLCGQDQSRARLRWTDRESPPFELCQTLIKTIPASRTPASPWQYTIFTRGANCSITHTGKEERRLCAGRGLAREGFQYTVYSECIVTCVCCQVLLNYIFVCNVETTVSFLYGGTTGCEQSDL